ncbi:MAG: molybdate ABC transporter permease subunit [Planctomycetota bacterium]|nr:MAG: molybdate ABC transporter permease subunit [Planctomycetota bacterium]
MDQAWGPLILSFQMAGMGLFLAMLLGVPLALALALGRWRGRDVVEVILTAPLVLPPTVLGYYVLVALGRNSVIGRAWENLTGSPIVFTPTGCLVAATLAALPFVVKGSRSAFEEVDQGLLAAATTLGAGPWRRIFTILIPLARRGIAGGCILGFAKALGDFGVTLMVAGNIPGLTQTAPLAIYDFLLAGRDGQAAGLALTLTALALFILWLVNFYIKPQRRDEAST